MSVHCSQAGEKQSQRFGADSLNGDRLYAIIFHTGTSESRISGKNSLHIDGFYFPQVCLDRVAKSGRSCREDTA
jgi:hypothetical protein